MTDASFSTYACQHGYNPYAAADTGWFGGKLVKSVGRGISSAVNTVVNVADKVPGMGVFTSQARFVSNVARGKNVLNSARTAAKSAAADFGRSAQVASSGASFVPGIGTAAGAGLNAMAAVSRGASLRSIGQAALVGAVPGGPLAKAALGAMQAGLKGQSLAHIAEAAARGAIPANIMAAVDLAGDAIRGKNLIRAALDRASTAFVGGSPEAAGFNVAKSLLTGGNVTVAVLSAARSRLPTEGARRAFDTAVGSASAIAPAAKRQLPRSAVLGSVSRFTFGRASAAHVPLTQRAAELVAANARGATMGALFGRRETAGLSADAVLYTVEAGDSAWAIAKKLMGDGNLWKQLVAANSTKKKGKDGNFATLFTGEKLTIPGTWRAKLAPTIKADVLNQARAILIVWSTTDGRQQAGITDYGARVEDAQPTWGPRDRLTTASFAAWRNNTKGTKLPTAGDLTDQLATELRAWAAEHASWNLPKTFTEAPAPAAVPVAAPPPPPVAVPVAAPPQPIAPLNVPPPPPPAAVSVAAPPQPVNAPIAAPSPAIQTQPPADILAMASAAQASGNAATMRQVAQALRNRGYSELAARLDASAAGLDATPKPTAGADVQALAAAAQSSGNPATMRQVAAQLRAKGYPSLAEKLEASANALEAQRRTAAATAPATDDGGGLGLLAIGGIVMLKVMHVL